MDDFDSILDKLAEAEKEPGASLSLMAPSEQEQRIARHRSWLNIIRHERPDPATPAKVAIYIRYFNQTRYANYLDYHIKQYQDTLALCPKWDLVDIYIDEGQVAPNMESAPQWSRLLQDCFDGKVDLIITQKVSNVSRKPYEITMISRILAAQKRPIGIYFVSEDIFTLASYYQHDLHDNEFFPDENWQCLPDDDDKEPIPIAEVASSVTG